VTATTSAPAGTERAHVLLQVEPGRAEEAVRYVSALAGVESVAMTSGPFDVIAQVSAAELSRMLGRLRRTPGLWALRICRSA
jgi:hypothetical protein